jgi:hypothetical protein
MYLPSSHGPTIATPDWRHLINLTCVRLRPLIEHCCRWFAVAIFLTIGARAEHRAVADCRMVQNGLETGIGSCTGDCIEPEMQLRNYFTILIEIVCFEFR